MALRKPRIQDTRIRGDQRRAPRTVRREPVRYWLDGPDPTISTGFMRDISSNGVFIETYRPLPQGTHVHLEILEDGKPLVVDAVVVRRVQIAPELRKLGPSGMGLRFLVEVESTGAAAMGSEPDDADDGRKAAPRTAAPPGRRGPYVVRFRQERALLEACSRDISRRGGLFLPTELPADLNDTVTIEFRFPGDETEPLRVEATVVQRIAPEQSQRDRVPAGMAVVFAESEAILDSLNRSIESLPA